jgi:hypothetical protein
MHPFTARNSEHTFCFPLQMTSYSFIAEQDVKATALYQDDVAFVHHAGFGYPADKARLLDHNFSRLKLAAC